MTRWQGAMMLMGLAPLALATAQQFFPNPFLELRPDEKQWKVKRGALTAKVFVELLVGDIGYFRRLHNEIRPKQLL